MVRIIIFLALVVSSCRFSQSQVQCLRLDEKTPNYKYGQDINLKDNRASKAIHDSLTKLVSFIFINNPYCLDSSYNVRILANNSLIYFGSYQQSLNTDISQIREGESVHFILEITTPKNSKTGNVYGFQDKSVFSWRKDFKFIYIGLFPTNEETEQIHFFP